MSHSSQISVLPSASTDVSHPASPLPSLSELNLPPLDPQRLHRRKRVSEPTVADLLSFTMGGTEEGGNREDDGRGPPNINLEAYHLANPLDSPIDRFVEAQTIVRPDGTLMRNLWILDSVETITARARSSLPPPSFLQTYPITPPFPGTRLVIRLSSLLSYQELQEERSLVMDRCWRRTKTPHKQHTV